jgi:voltage-gated potassium channel
MTRTTDSKPVSSSPRDMPTLLGRPSGGWRARMFDVIFSNDTPAGRRFDIALVAIILLSILVVVLDSVPSIGEKYAGPMSVLEWSFTIFFTLEYIARLVCVQRPMRYARSFYGVIDLVSVLPTWISLLVPGSQVFLDVRILRLLRIFRILKLTRYVEEYTRLGEALVASKRKIMVFLSVVLMLILILGTVMYVVEGPANGFTSIPMAMYWATVTITTVGYGDLTPHTPLGKAIASFMMLLGWGILAVPTGIVSAEMTSQKLSRHAPRELWPVQPRTCSGCGSTGHDPRAHFCKDCGVALAPETHFTT